MTARAVSRAARRTRCYNPAHMSLITRCPACGTMFKVVPDQLRISEGWVRCGHCAEVFDASAHLQVRSVPRPLQRSPSPRAADRTGPRAPYQPSPALAGPRDRTRRIPQVLPRRATRAEVAAARATDRGRSEPADRIPTAAAAGLSPPTPARRRRWRKCPSCGRPAAGPLAATRVCARAGLAGAGARRAARRAGRRARPRPHRGAQPALRPWIEATVRAARCRLGTPRQIEAIVDRQSSFNKLRGDAYRLAFTLQEQGARRSPCRPSSSP